MESIKISLDGNRLDSEIKNVPVGFVNALRRILLAEIPTVVIANVQILDNTTQMTHEMLKHRVEMLPVAVTAEEVGVIRDTSIELRYLMAGEPRESTSDDFVVSGPRKDVLLRDRELGTPMLFLNLNANESLHIKANLVIETKGASQVCVSTFKNHIDPILAQRDKDSYVASAGEDKMSQNVAAKVFDNFHVQRSYSKNEMDRPNWFDFTIESIGVQPAKDLLRKAVEILKAKINDWVQSPVLREEAGWYRVETETEGHTLGALAQSVILSSGLVEFVSYNIPHPLRPLMVLRFNTKNIQPEVVLERFKQEALAMCESVLKSV